MPNSKKSWIFSLLGLWLGLSGCSNLQLQQKQAPIVVASFGSIDTIDPAQATTTAAIQLLSSLGDPLYGINADGQIEPKLALALPQISNQGLRAVIQLRKGVIFHDGTAFNAEAMAFSLRRFIAIAKLSYVVGDRITAVKVLGPYELELTLRRPFSPLAALLSSTSLTPVSPTAYKKHQRSFLTGNFVGTGPYQLSFTSPQLQRLTPFEKYWGQKPSNNGIAMVSMGTSTTLFGALMGRDVDVLLSSSTEFNAEAMAFRLLRFIQIAKLSYVVGDRITAVKVLGPYELELTLRRPFSPLAALLSSTSLTPVSPTAYKKHQRSFLTGNFVGTGPYQLSFTSPQLQRLTPFEKYWGQKPSNNGIAMVSMGTSTTLFGALMGRDVDVLLSSSIEPDQQKTLRKEAQRGVLREGVGPALEIGYLSVLSDRPPLNRLGLRQALAYSLSRPQISARVSDNIRTPLYGLVPPSLAGAKAGWPEQNLAVARKLFEQEGYCAGKTLALNLTYRSNVPTDRLFALTWQEMLNAKLGDCLQLKITGMESTTAYRQLGDGAFQLIMLDWSGDYPDPDNYLVPLLACKRPQGYVCLEGESAASGSFWAAPGLQKQLLETEQITGPARLEMLKTVQQRAALGVPYLPIWLVRSRAWARPPVSTPRFDGSGRLILAQLQIGKGAR